MTSDSGEHGEFTRRMGLVGFAFGAAAAPFDGELPGGALSGKALVGLLGELGLSAGAARALLLRMRREGWLHSQRQGREARYRLDPAITAAQHRIEWQMRGQRPQWEGSYRGILYEIPEQARPFRDRLRRTALLLGYATLRPGLLIATTDRWDQLRTLLPPQPPGSQLLNVRIMLALDDSRMVAARLWDLGNLADRYRQMTADLRALAAHAGDLAPGSAAFRVFAAGTIPAYELTAEDPDLPADLLPDDWPGPELSAALGQVLRAFYPLIRDFLIAAGS